MKTFLLLLLIPALSVGQTVPVSSVNEVAWPLYRGNPGEQTLILPRGDSLATVTAQAIAIPTESKLPTNLQPTVSRISQTVKVSFSNAQSLLLPPIALVEVRTNNTVRVVYRLTVDKTTIATKPGTLTLINSITQINIIASGAGATGNQTVNRPVANATNGSYTITHNLGTHVISSVCVWEDSRLPDRQWYYEPVDDNHAILRGPPGETFTGDTSVTGYKNLTNQ